MGACRGILILQHESSPKIYRKLARVLSGTVSRNRPEFSALFSEAATRVLFQHSFCKFKRERSENVLGKSDFYRPLMVLAEQWQCSLYANVLFVQSSVPTMFLHFFANGRVTNGRVPNFQPFFPCPQEATPNLRHFRGQNPRSFFSRRFLWVLNPSRRRCFRMPISLC